MGSVHSTCVIMRKSSPPQIHNVLNYNAETMRNKSECLIRVYYGYHTYSLPCYPIVYSRGVHEGNIVHSNFDFIRSPLYLLNFCDRSLSLFPRGLLNRTCIPDEESAKERRWQLFLPFPSRHTAQLVSYSSLFSLTGGLSFFPLLLPFLHPFPTSPFSIIRSLLHF